MTRRQKYRRDFSKGIYNRLKSLNKVLRGKNGFNWFESTSFDGDKANGFNHKIRFWKFIPANHKIDRDWQNERRQWDGTKHIDVPF